VVQLIVDVEMSGKLEGTQSLKLEIMMCTCHLEKRKGT